MTASSVEELLRVFDSTLRGIKRYHERHPKHRDDDPLSDPDIREIADAEGRAKAEIEAGIAP